MPKLRGSKLKYVNGYAVDKENDNIIYSDEKHIYIGKTDNSKYESVTTIIGQYCQKFDSDFWSSYKACEALLDPAVFYPLKSKLLSSKKWKESYIEEYELDPVEFLNKKSEILQSYEDKRNASTERGTKIHAMMEDLFYQGDKKAINKYAGGGTFEVKKGYYKLDIDRAIYPEFLISYEFDEYLKIAGQIDYLQISDNEVVLLDWKTNGRIDKESYFDRTTKKRQMMLSPLENIMDCNLCHYQLQLSMYAYLLQKINPKFKIKKLAIVHFDHDGNETEYEVKYLKDDIARLLLYHRKKNKIKAELDKDKPIVFLNIMIMENVDDLYENRMKICKECPLYLDSPMGARCNSRLYLSEADKKTVSDRPKLGFRAGCGCLLERRTKLPHAKCVIGKW